MGTVYLAERHELQRQVAIKMPRFKEDPTGEVLARFYREAAGRGQHSAREHLPGLRRRKDRQEALHLDGLHRGASVAKFIRSGKPQPERQILFAIHKLALCFSKLTITGSFTGT